MIANITEIHSGDSTQSHDHSITLQSFSTIKAIVSKLVKPMPPAEAELSFLFFKFLTCLSITSALMRSGGCRRFFGTARSA